MLIEPVNGSGKGATPLAPTELFGGAKAALTLAREDTGPPAAPAPAELAEMAVDVQANLQVMHDIALNFSVDETSGRTVVVVADENTGEIIREIPSAEFLALSARLDEMLGILFDQKG